MTSGHPEVGRPRVGYSCRHRRDTLACSSDTRPLADVVIIFAPQKSGGDVQQLSQRVGLGGTRDGFQAGVFEGKDPVHGSPCYRKRHLGTTCRVGRTGRTTGIFIWRNSWMLIFDKDNELPLEDYTPMRMPARERAVAADVESSTIQLRRIEIP
ncbi:hypothetical protein ARMGADRAFT_1079691 [Armillaria gallica]|uniref:Uncharacterized protein n=1 Tax=Armillaria gallica TaxID=47427 RepID=A0A2H3DHP3_ARMGA|nr:hypothetical protein ARMGADRAFT_1079691 [Armillaria gallica]